MKDYEVTYLVQNEDVYKNKPVENAIEKIGGKVVSSKPWGQKNLAYPIKKLNTAFIVTDVFSVEPSSVMKLERQLHLNPAIMRFLIVKDVQEVPNLGEEIDTRTRPEGRPEYHTTREPKVIVSAPQKPVEVKPTEKPAPVKPKKIVKPSEEEVSKELDKIIEPKAEETPKKAEKLVKKSPAKKAPVSSTAPTDEERLKQLESKLQDLLKE